MAHSLAKKITGQMVSEYKKEYGKNPVMKGVKERTQLERRRHMERRAKPRPGPDRRASVKARPKNIGKQAAQKYLKKKAAQKFGTRAIGLATKALPKVSLPLSAAAGAYEIGKAAHAGYKAYKAGRHAQKTKEHAKKLKKMSVRERQAYVRSK